MSEEEEDPPFENTIYDMFPSGEDDGHGSAEGFATFFKLNDKSLFTSEALDDPVVQAFVSAPFDVTFVQFKSSHLQTEYYLHKPLEAMAGAFAEKGIKGTVGQLAGDPGIGTFVINHERTLAIHIMRALVISDGVSVGQIIHKEEQT